MFEQHFDQVSVAVARSGVQCAAARRAGTLRPVGIGTALEQQFHHFYSAADHRAVQGGSFLVIGCVQQLWVIFEEMADSG